MRELAEEHVQARSQVRALVDAKGHYLSGNAGTPCLDSAEDGMDQWEYRMIPFGTGGFLGGKIDAEQLTARLNELGQQGWELVSLFTTNQGQGMTRDVIAALKRRK